MKRKTHFLVLLAFSMLFLVGSGRSQVKLLDDTKLIDLDKAIEYVRPGGEWEETQITESDSTEEVEQIVEVEDNTSVTESVDSKDITIEIYVSGESIIYVDNPINDLKKIEKLIRRDNKENVTFILVDDWAESKTYKDANELMTQLKNELGIKYRLETKDE